MSDRNTRLNKRYRDEGWGHITDAALGIAPVDVESQARSVASYAADEIERLRHDIERYIAITSDQADEIERLRAELEIARDAIDFAHSEGFEWPSNPIAAMNVARSGSATQEGA